MVEVTDLDEDELVRKGWERRSILDEPRLSEVVETYRGLGLEVLLRDLEPGSAEACTVCTDGAPGRYRVVYTRPTSGGVASAGSSDLFD